MNRESDASQQQTTAERADDTNADLHKAPWFALGYLMFLFLPFLFVREPGGAMFAATWLSALLFVPVFFGFYRGGRRFRRIAIGFAALLGFAVFPFNPGGNTFLIYAIAMAGHALPSRRAVLLCAALLAALCGQVVWLGGQQWLWGFFAMTAVIGVMVLASGLYARDRERRNAELKLNQDEIKRLARLAERERIGRDLHDLLGHTLSLVAIKSELAGKLFERDPRAAREQIREVERVARDALAQVRQAVSGIRAAGLEAELAAARLALLSGEVRLDQRLAPVELAPEVETALALALREAVTNVLRHARASRVEVELAREDGFAVLGISDDGLGGVASDGHGLAGMRERLAAVGGALDIDSTAGGGTRLRLRVPRLPVERATQPAVAPRLSH